MRRVVFAALACAFVAAPALADFYGFDDVVAPALFADVIPGGPLGPVVVGSGVTFDGGVILNDTAFGNWATSKPNLYATSDFVPLADGSLLPGFITGTFAVPTTAVTLSLDAINGFIPGTFTLSAFDSSSTLLDSDSAALGAFSGAPPALLSVSGPAIAYFTVTSDQPTGSIDFAIDSVNFGVVPVPVPGAVLLGMLGLAAAGRKLRKMC